MIRMLVRGGVVPWATGLVPFLQRHWPVGAHTKHQIPSRLQPYTSPRCCVLTDGQTENKLPKIPNPHFCAPSLPLQIFSAPYRFSVCQLLIALTKPVQQQAYLTWEFRDVGWYAVRHFKPQTSSAQGKASGVISRSAT
jgi:hypothetical protein